MTWSRRVRQSDPLPSWTILLGQRPLALMSSASPLVPRSIPQLFAVCQETRSQLMMSKQTLDTSVDCNTERRCYVRGNSSSRSSARRHSPPLDLQCTSNTNLEHSRPAKGELGWSAVVRYHSFDVFTVCRFISSINSHVICLVPVHFLFSCFHLPSINTSSRYRLSYRSAQQSSNGAPRKSLRIRQRSLSIG